jgi:hypothetical protein
LIGAADKTHDDSHMITRPRFKVAILGDFQNVALRMADWSAVTSRADVTVFNACKATAAPVAPQAEDHG